jgi:alpha-beta hydrolase superfamily lysophospholipase
MIGKFLRYVRTHWRLCGGMVFLAAVIAINVMAFLHAYAMTHFVEGGARTGGMKTLSPWQKGKVLLTGIRIPRPVCDATPADRGMDYQVYQMAGASGLQLEAWYIPVKDSRGLCVLFHGYAECKSQLLPEAQALRELGYDTLLVDFRGSGGSTGQVTTIGFHEADDVAVAVEFARRTLKAERPILFGRSMGAAAILRAVAVHGVEPRAVIVECPFDRLLSTARNRFATMGIPSFPCAELLIFWGGVQHGYSGFQHNPVEYAQQVRCPVLLMHGGLDPRVTRAQAQGVFSSLAGPKRFLVLENTGHEPCIAGNADRWREAIVDFLEHEGQPR